MKDFVGNELEIGQKVICLTAGSSTSWMIWGEVIGFTPQKVRLTIRKRPGYSVTTLRDPHAVVIPMTEDLANELRSEYLRSS